MRYMFNYSLLSKNYSLSEKFSVFRCPFIKSDTIDFVNYKSNNGERWDVKTILPICLDSFDTSAWSLNLQLYRGCGCRYVVDNR